MDRVEYRRQRRPGLDVSKRAPVPYIRSVMGLLKLPVPKASPPAAVGSRISGGQAEVTF